MSTEIELRKPNHGDPCSGCGFCCTVEPCGLAREYLHCTTGPCVALEVRDGRTHCGLVRNPLGYLFAATRPEVELSPALQEAPSLATGHELSVRFAAALGLGAGCDAEDDAESATWVLRIPAQPIQAR